MRGGLVLLALLGALSVTPAAAAGKPSGRVPCPAAAVAADLGVQLVVQRVRAVPDGTRLAFAVLNATRGPLLVVPDGILLTDESGQAYNVPVVADGVAIAPGSQQSFVITAPTTGALTIQVTTDVLVLAVVAPARCG